MIVRKIPASMHRRRPDSNRDMADLQSAALAIWLRRPKIPHKPHHRQIRYKPSIFAESLALQYHPTTNLPKNLVLTRHIQKKPRFCRCLQGHSIRIPSKTSEFTTVLPYTRTWHRTPLLCPEQYRYARHTIHCRCPQKNAVCQNP